MVGLRHGQGATPGAPVPQGAEAGKLEQSIQSLHKYSSYCTALCTDPGCILLLNPILPPVMFAIRPKTFYLPMSEVKRLPATYFNAG